MTTTVRGPWLRSVALHVDVPALAARFVAAAGGPSTAEALLVPEASHSLATPPDVAAEHLFPAVDRLLRAVK